NQGLGQLELWNEDAIKERADKLAAMALNVWSAPQLSPDILMVYKPQPAPSVYSIDDHQFLQIGPLRDVFEAFRKEVLALDPCVTEEFLKFYIAYKAETNFVDIIPRVKRLRLSLNIKFSEII